MSDTADSRDAPGADELRGELLRVVEELGHERRDEPFELSSGELSHDFVDAKRALARGAHLRLACELMVRTAADLGIDFDAVGGLTLGADHFSHGVALVADKQWFVVRKRRKGRGTDQLVEGAAIGPGTRVLLVDDVVSTGGSIRQAHEAVLATGAEVVLASTLVDRGDSARAFFRSVDVPYAPLLTYDDLGIPPIGAAAPTSGG